MTASLVPPVVHGWTWVTDMPPAEHHPVCAIWNSYTCTCRHREIRMTRPLPVAKPVQLACDDDPEGDPNGMTGKSYPIGDDPHATRCREQGFPWCDICKRPAVFSEGFGNLHSTPDSPFGVAKARDDSGHEVTMREWWGWRAS